MKTTSTPTVRKTSLLAAAALAALVVGITGCGGDDTAAAEPPAQTMAADTSTGETSASADTNIVETAVAAGQFKTLTSLLQQTGLDKTLAEGGPYTVFAPTDKAFAKVPKKTLDALAANPDELKAVLLYHVADGAVKAADVASMSSVETLNGASVPIKANDSVVRVGGAKLIQADVMASNGVIHVIDGVLIPPQ
jgi:uncharacterized surface protein with fasciclin (FAS1) repeats